MRSFKVLSLPLQLVFLALLLNVRLACKNFPKKIQAHFDEGSVTKKNKVLKPWHQDVKGLTPMKEYKFRVCAVNEEGESLPLVGDETIVAKDPFGEPGPPRNLEIVDYDQVRILQHFLNP